MPTIELSDDLVKFLLVKIMESDEWSPKFKINTGKSILDQVDNPKKLQISYDDIEAHNLAEYVEQNRFTGEPAYERLREAAIKFENSFNEHLIIRIIGFKPKDRSKDE